MAEPLKVERKCDSCGKWIQGIHRLCPLCGDHVDHRTREIEEKEQRAEEEVERKREEFLAKPPVTRFFLKILKIIELVYMSIIGFIAWLLFWLGG